MSDFMYAGRRYHSMEQYMMYQKAVVFKDKDIASQILKTNDVARIKDFGRQVSNYNDSVWNGMRQIVIYKGLLEKFRQNEKLKKALLDTGDDILAECAVSDKIWGIGLSMKDSNKNDIKRWIRINAGKE